MDNSATGSPPVRAASYERVSTFVQAQRGYSLGAQTQDVATFAASQGWVLPDHLRFRDGETENASGADWDLPGVNAMLDAAKRKEFRVLIVPDRDRLARNLGKAIVLTEELRRLGIQVVFMRAPVEDTAEGRFLNHQLFAFAEYEREKIVFRTARGRRAKAERGLVVGVGKAPYGYRYVVGDRGQRVGLELDPLEAPVARRILTDFVTRSTADVAQALNDEGIPSPIGKRWDAATILRLAKNRAYRGELQYGRRSPVRVPIPVLLDPTEWDRLQRVLDDRRV